MLSGAKYEPELVDNAYKVFMKLTIKSVGMSDYGSYKCVSKNSLGETDGTIKLYRKFIQLQLAYWLFFFCLSLKLFLVQYWRYNRELWVLQEVLNL